MTELKREYVIPLRRKTRLAPKWRRSKKAVSVLKEFIAKHMKTDNVVICAELNEMIWERGIKNPPGKVSVVALKTQIAGVEKTLVNLVEIGVDKYLEIYKSQQQITPEDVAPEKEDKTVVDAQVKDVIEEPDKAEEIIEDETKKKEVKKDE